MSAAPKLAPTSEAPARRSFSRYPINVPLDVIILRSGIPDSVPGRCTDLSEGGVGAIVAGELGPGQQVAIELRLPNVGVPVRARALVRYHDQLRCGLQFLALSSEQCGMIRYWVYQNAPVSANGLAATLEWAKREEPVPITPKRGERKFHIRRRTLSAVLLGILTLGVMGWWEWQRAWRELEMQPTAATIESQPASPLRISSNVMDKRIISRLAPVYPEDARLAKIQGLVILDAIIGSDGTVKHLRPISGPFVLAQAALDAVQAWRFDPYRISGQPTEVETTIAVEFRLN